MRKHYRYVRKNNSNTNPAVANHILNDNHAFSPKSEVMSYINSILLMLKDYNFMNNVKYPGTL